MATAATHEIETAELLTPMSDPGSFFRRLHASINAAQSMQAAVAYWTIEPHYVHAGLPKLLSAPSSFLCVDIHLPTSIDQLRRLAANINLLDYDKNYDYVALPLPHLFVHLRAPAGQPEVPYGGQQMPDHLLHPKLLLFEMGDGSAEVWVGSHNWTHRALSGLNLEATVVLRVSQTAGVYAEAREALSQMRELCLPFDYTLVNYYKWLQGLLEPQVLFELEGDDVRGLAGTQLKLFGTDLRDFESLNTVGKRIYLSAMDSKTGKESLYRAKITTATASHVDIATLAEQLPQDQQRYVHREGRVFPVLEPPLAGAKRNELVRAAYCVAIQVGGQLPDGVQVLEPKHEERWAPATNDALLARLKQPTEADLLTTTPEYEHGVREVVKKLSILRPADPSEFRLPYLRTLAQKRSSPNPDLFTRKYVDDPA